MYRNGLHAGQRHKPMEQEEEGEGHDTDRVLCEVEDAAWSSHDGKLIHSCGSHRIRRVMQDYSGLIWSRFTGWQRQREITRCCPSVPFYSAHCHIQVSYDFVVNLQVLGYNKALMQKEELVEKVVTLQWLEEKGAIRTYIEEFIHNMECYPCPSLKEMCTQAILRKYPQLHKKFDRIRASFCQ